MTILNKSHAATRAERRRESATFQRELDDMDALENELFDALTSGATDREAYQRSSWAQAGVQPMYGGTAH